MTKELTIVLPIHVTIQELVVMNWLHMSASACMVTLVVIATLTSMNARLHHAIQRELKNVLTKLPVMSATVKLVSQERIVKQVSCVLCVISQYFYALLI